MIMENKMNIFEKLSAIQNELKAPKNQYNSFGKYNYRSCEDILESVKPLCRKYRTLLLLSDEIVVIGDNNPTIVNEKTYDKNHLELKNDERVSSNQRYYIKAIATLYDLDSDKSISNTAFARESENKTGMDASQITGATSSYARKYALNGLFCIDDTKDADTDEYQNQTKEQPKKQAVSKATKKQIELINELFNEEEIAKALDLVKKENIEDLTVVEASSLISKRKKVEE